MKIRQLYEQLKKADEIQLGIDNIALQIEIELDDGTLIKANPTEIISDYTSEMGVVTLKLSTSKGNK